MYILENNKAIKCQALWNLVYTDLKRKRGFMDPLIMHLIDKYYAIMETNKRETNRQKQVQYIEADEY